MVRKGYRISRLPDARAGCKCYAGSHAADHATVRILFPKFIYTPPAQKTECDGGGFG